MEAEIDFHERICLKKHRNIALAVFAYCSFEIALIARSLVIPSVRPAESVVFRIFFTAAALFTIFIALNFFRLAKCTSEKAILGVFALCLGLGLLKAWSNAPAHTLEQAKLVLYSIALLFATSDLYSAVFRR